MAVRLSFFKSVDFYYIYSSGGTSLRLNIPGRSNILAINISEEIVCGTVEIELIRGELWDLTEGGLEINEKGPNFYNFLFPTFVLL